MNSWEMLKGMTCQVVHVDQTASDRCGCIHHQFGQYRASGQGFDLRPSGSIHRWANMTKFDIQESKRTVSILTKPK